MNPKLEIRGACKRFSRVQANDNISLSLGPGEVRALLGENGAGKSTLMNCLYGLIPMDRGEIFIDGRKADIKNCNDAIALGIGMVNQHFMLIERLAVWENIILGLKKRGHFGLDPKGAARKIRELSDQYNLNIDPNARIEELSVGMEQKVEILKILYRDSRIMIFDEPTAVLTPGEVVEFYKIIGKLKSVGRTIIFITHKLNEVMRISDSVTVLRDGRVVGNVKTRETSVEELARMMVGREVNLKRPELPNSCGANILSVKGLYVNDKKGRPAVKGLSFNIRAGEILGIAGVDGNGQSELGQALAGLADIEKGSISIEEVNTTLFDPGKLIAAGVSHIPEDRQKSGLVLDFSVEENLVLKEIGCAPFSRGGVIKRSGIRLHAEGLIKKYGIRVFGPDAGAKELSGGNQQKVILAREFERGPKLIIAVQPSRGLDISGIEFVRDELIRQRNNGAAVLLISTELEEILALSDRIEVIYEGEFTGAVSRRTANPVKIGLQMAGRGKAD
ncbi:MAG: ABC transporter ATP-binding protein [Spirochaetales bacterium]|nr:ABC transporter ATP-binding protein [Spirochaetales bacterium]